MCCVSAAIKIVSNAIFSGTTYQNSGSKLAYMTSPMWPSRGDGSIPHKTWMVSWVPSRDW